MESPISMDNNALLPALLQGDEAIFIALVNQHQSAMLRVCMIFIDDAEIAQEVVQDTWLDMLKGLEHFEGRSSLKTWLFTILTNKAKTRGKKERRSIPISDLEDPEIDEDGPSADPQRFLPAGHPWAGHWAVKPQPWGHSIEEDYISRELLDNVREAIKLLPDSQRAVVSLRDIEGWNSDEVCNVLGLTETNQRVLLHRARSKVRRALEQYFDQKAVLT